MNPLAAPDLASGRVDLDAIDAAHSWHPFTQMSEYLGRPRLQIERGEGCWLVDTAGRRYLDTNASVWTNVHGHNDPELNGALREQLGRLAHSTWLGLSHTAGTAFTQKLVELAPANLTRVFFSDNGSNAVEIALKLSFQYWQLSGRGEKTLAVGMKGGYHGDTFGTMAVGGSDTFHGRFSPWCFEARHFPAPSEDDDAASLAALAALLEAEGERTACLVLEPWIQGAAGMQLQPRGFVREVAALCRAHEVHLILDEVFVGFGRAGPFFFVCAEEGVEPDFLCLAKGLSGGYLPMAATLAPEPIYEAFLGPFDSFRAFFHGHTFTANPLAAAVSLKSAEKLENLIAGGRLSGAIDHFGRRLRATFEGHPYVAAVRQRGMAAAVDLKPRHGEAFPVGERRGMQVAVAARDVGLLMRPVGDTLLIVPPLVISPDEIEFLFTNALKAVEQTLANAD